MWVESSEQSFMRSLEEELQAVLADKADLQASVAQLQVPHEEGMMGTQSPHPPHAPVMPCVQEDLASRPAVRRLSDGGLQRLRDVRASARVPLRDHPC